MSLSLSVVIITLNEEQNLGRTLESVQPLVRDGQGEIIVVDSGSTDRTIEVAKSFGAKVFVEPWKGFAGQKNSAIEKATGDWVLSLDADEAVSSTAAEVIGRILGPDAGGYERCSGVWLARKNFFLGRWIKHGGFYPDKKLRLFRRGKGRFQDRPVHETVVIEGGTESSLEMDYNMGSEIALEHHAYPTLEIYLEHMGRYADLGAEMVKDKPRWCLWLNRWLNPPLSFLYNYFFRFGFLDGREGFLLHRYHARYVGWKYAKALARSRSL